MFFVPNNKKMSFKNTHFFGILLAFALLKYVQICERLPHPIPLLKN